MASAIRSPTRLALNPAGLPVAEEPLVDTLSEASARGEPVCRWAALCSYALFCTALGYDPTDPLRNVFYNGL
eukprot:1205269-Rhodomonas_salina.1